jgi:hypothetical protein
MMLSEAQALQSDPAKHFARLAAAGGLAGGGSAGGHKEGGSSGGGSNGGGGSGSGAARLPADLEAAVTRAGPAAIDPPDMRQSIAWQLAARALKRSQLEEAEAVLRRETGADHLKEVQLQLEVGEAAGLQRSAAQALRPLEACSAAGCRPGAGCSWRPALGEAILAFLLFLEVGCCQGGPSC